MREIESQGVYSKIECGYFGQDRYENYPSFKTSDTEAKNFLRAQQRTGMFKRASEPVLVDLTIETLAKDFSYSSDLAGDIFVKDVRSGELTPGGFIPIAGEGASVR